MKFALHLALLLLASALSLHAQLSQPSPLPLKGPLSDIPTAPPLRDSNGNIIQPSPPTPEQIEAQRREEQARRDKLRAEEEKQAADQRLRDEQRESERRAEERDGKNQKRTLIYVVLAVVATILASRLFKGSAK